MKVRIYKVKQQMHYSFHVCSVDDNGKEEFLRSFAYDETRDPKVWSKDLAFKNATDFVKTLEAPDNYRKLVYETGRADNEGCVKYETE